MSIFQRVLWGNTLTTWSMAILVAVFVFVALNLIKRIAGQRIRALIEKTETDLDDLVVDLLGRTWYFFLLSVSIYAGTLVLELPKVENGIRTTTIALFLIQLGLWGNGTINYIVKRQVEKRSKTDAAAATTITAMGFVSKVILWTIVVLLALDNFPKVEVDTLIASLGIGGVAVALAVQNILGDLFASLSIVLDKPFIIGDFITVENYQGTVVHIGLKSTRLRSLTGEQLIFSNSDLLNSRIRNYKRMEERRVVFTISVTYQTPHEKLVVIPALIQEIIEVQPQASFDRAHFKEYGEFALNFEVVYYMLTSDYDTFMDAQQAINLALFKRFAEEGIAFAYPTQTVLVG